MLEIGKLYKAHTESFIRWRIKQPSLLSNTFLLVGWKIYPIKTSSIFGSWSFQMDLTILLENKVEVVSVKRLMPPKNEWEQYVLYRTDSEGYYLSPRGTKVIWEDFNILNFPCFTQLNKI